MLNLKIKKPVISMPLCRQFVFRTVLASFIFIGVGICPTIGQEGINLIEIAPATKADLSLTPKNLARWHMDTSLLVSEGDGLLKTISLENEQDFEESALLGDDESITYRIAEGEKAFTLDLGDYFNLNRFFFDSHSAQGQVEIKVSNTLRYKDSNRWIAITEPIDFKSGESVNIVFPMIEGRFVRINFSIINEGEISSFGLFGETTVAETEIRKSDEGISERNVVEGVETITQDFASLHSGSNITHVSSGDLVDVNSMIDDDVLTSYDFAGGEKESVLVLDIDKQSDVDRISLILDAGRGKMDFYFLDELPITSLSRSAAAIEEPSISPEGTRAPQNQALIIITNIKGDVTYRVSANAPAQIGQNGVRLTEGTIVETGSGSSSVLLFSNGSTVTLSENTSINIDQFSQDPFNAEAESFANAVEEPSISRTKLRLNVGELVGEVKKLNPGSSYEIDTPVGIRGTHYIVQVIEAIDGSFSALFGVKNGLLEVLPLNQSGINIPSEKQIIINLSQDADTGKTSFISTGLQDLATEIATKIEQFATDASDLFKENAGGILLIDSSELTGGADGIVDSEDFAVVLLSEEFFNQATPTSSQPVDDKDQRIRMNFEEITGRYLVLRWRPEDTDSQGLRIYEISVLGEVPIKDVVLAVVPLFEFGPTETEVVTDIDDDTEDVGIVIETPTEIIIPDPITPPDPPPDPPPASP